MNTIQLHMVARKAFDLWWERLTTCECGQCVPPKDGDQHAMEGMFVAGAAIFSILAIQPDTSVEELADVIDATARGEKETLDRRLAATL